MRKAVLLLAINIYEALGHQPPAPLGQKGQARFPGSLYRKGIPWAS